MKLFEGSKRSACHRRILTALNLALAACLCACAAASRSPDATAPRASEPSSVMLPESARRREDMLTAWSALMLSQGITNAPAPELQPITATIKSIPPLSPQLRLPKVGSGAEMTDEEMRESLRRFIVAEQFLLGATPQQLSLVLQTNLADGTKKAEYQQRPSLYPLRGGYGSIEIGFTTAGRILSISSSAIPEIEQLQRALASLAPAANAEQVAASMKGRAFTYTDLSGSQQTFTATEADEINVRELVIYPLARTDGQPTLELHLAWEIVVGRGPTRTVYLDAVTNRIIAARQTPQT